jgi:hypothetical protein
MTFREVYKEEMNLIKADETVVDGILLKMRKEVQTPAPFIRRIPVSRLATAAAGTGILIAAAVLIPMFLNSSPNFQSDIGAAPMSELNMTFSINDDSYTPETETEEAGRAVFDTATGIPAEVPALMDAPQTNRADSHADSGAPMGGGGAEAALDDDSPSDMTLPPPEAAPAPESEPPTVSSDAASPVSADEWMQYWLQYYEYYDYQTYGDWDDGTLWDNLGGFPAVEIPLIIPQWVRDLPPDVVWDSPFSEHTFNTLGEALGYFLSEEHRLAFISYYYTLDEHGDSFGEHIDFYERTLEEAAPIYSMLSRNMNSGLTANASFYLGDIGISILGENGFVSLHLRPCNTLTFSASGTYLNYELEDGTFEKLLAYLLHIG